jgi:hypothetical protein
MLLNAVLVYQTANDNIKIAFMTRVIVYVDARAIP